MSTFAFLPRSIKQRKAETPAKQDQVSSSVASISTLAGAPIASESQSSKKWKGDAKGKAKDPTDLQTSSGHKAILHSSAKSLEPEDLARVVCLALSDYNLWSDSDLRRKIDWAGGGEFGQEDNVSIDDQGGKLGEDSGYIPLSYIKKNSAVFLQATSSPSYIEQPDIAYVKALRSHASYLVDVRLVLSTDQSSNFAPERWPRTGSSSTGYEVRRKKPIANSREFGKSEWDKLTVYIENIPVQYRSVYGVAKVVSSLLPYSEYPMSKVQNVSFPSHHNDRPGTLPTCKGFALVTLASDDDVNFLLDEWPWEESNHDSSQKSPEPRSDDPIRRESSKFGLRCLNKIRWDELKAEYLLYRQQLIAEVDADNKVQEQINKMSSNNLKVSQHSMPPAINKPDKVPVAEHLETTEQGQKDFQPIHAESSYPSGCLVFVRNIHPETNKTSLRALFSQFSQKDEKELALSINKTDGLDYVDYTKGLDSETGLDDSGEMLSSTSQDKSPKLAIIPEMVSGRREELYWQKVPERVRRQAVDKALSILNVGDAQTFQFERTSGKKRRRR
ncbi:hypothetical protein JR316_0004362 [Psilocybe cubensis]|uniref:Uncharacterized protein n=1 Tax=Psilocybe cubensis TaxID=181762 RepID=A0ACB8H3I0_PSICU|nr:hypothetical protein JR316_0004362 [Psilocybe cubensis]KAH9482264.1 hypothetical protein JR316_0004362 [Psilocybe cubensis]